MSEHLHPSERKEAQTPKVDHKEHLKAHHEKEASHAERKHNSHEAIEHSRKTIEQHAVSGAELTPGEKKHAQPHPVHHGKHFKQTHYQRTLVRTRKHLSAPGKAFSKFIHVDAIDRGSEFIGKTVARPTSMLWGAVFAFIGTSALLWTTRHYGYEYNYLVAIMLFVGGAALGLLAEGIWRSLKKRQS